MKFSNRLEYSTLFGHLLAERLADMEARPDLLVPVPLHHSRLRKRGYNQSWEITRSLARSSAIESSRTLCRRIRKTPLQTGLDAKQRRKNLKQAFQVTADLAGKHICIIDDVMTTGSTLNEMARTLKRAGAERVSGLVVARVVG
jgi:ComF family protein